MQAYIANLSDELNLDKIKNKVYIIYFSGNNFQNYNFNEFKSEHLVFLKDIKKEIENYVELIDSVIFYGGEPCLQRLALLDLARFSKLKKLKTILYTNGSKPESIKSLVKENLIDEVNLILDSPFNELFEQMTKSKTFFKSSEEIIDDIKQSIKILNDSQVLFNIKTKLSKKLIIKRENILEIAKIVENTRALWYIDKLDNSDRFLDMIKEMCSIYKINFSNEV